MQPATLDPMQIPADCIVFDTETTGLDPAEGDRLVEIGAVKMRDGLPTRETFHVYINPDRTVPDSSVRVHGLTTAFLADKPFFHEIAGDFLAFVGDLPMVAHNAGFDSRFINHELGELGLPAIDPGRFIDTVAIARKKFPGSPASLDALCKRFRISLAGREKHGALVDSELLAEVCVELMGGRQTDLFGTMAAGPAATDSIDDGPKAGLRTFVRRATPEEREAHAALVAKLGAGSAWTKILNA